MKLSIIIPSYNEEENLPGLLESIHSQDFKDYEVIVADANSTDKTYQVAKYYGCIVVEGGLPAVGRNNGAKVAKGDLLLFLDADLKLSKDYLKDAVEEFNREGLGIAISQMIPDSDKFSYKALHDFANTFMKSVENIKPHGAGCYGILTRKVLHDRVNGFDESLDYGEDTDYIERIGAISEFKVLRKPKVIVSTRRLEEDGLLKLIKTYGKSTVNDFRGKRTSADELGYSFEHGGNKKSKSKKTKPIHIKSSNKSNVSKNDGMSKLRGSKNKFNKSETKGNISLPKKESSNKKTGDASIENSQALIKSGNGLVESQKKIIFYCVCGEGMGHAIRSGVILERLTKIYDVYIFSGNRAYTYLNSKFDNVYEIGVYNTVYEDNVVNDIATFTKCMKESPSNIKKAYDTIFKLARKLKPGIIVTDFENYCNIVANTLNIPLISLDNIHMITETEIDYPPYHKIDMLKAKAVIKVYVHDAKIHILTSFFNPPIKEGRNSVIYPPILREDIMKLKPEIKDHVIVYQTSNSNYKLMERLKKIDENFIVYGFNKDEVDENLTYRSFNEDIFYDDLRTAKAVITNGGFTLISEAIYLKKPIYSIPALGNFEQILNGFYVDKLGYGEYHEDMESKNIKSFLSNLDKYQKNLNKVVNTDNSAIFNELYRDIEKYYKYS